MAVSLWRESGQLRCPQGVERRIAAILWRNGSRRRVIEQRKRAGAGPEPTGSRPEGAAAPGDQLLMRLVSSVTWL